MSAAVLASEHRLAHALATRRRRRLVVLLGFGLALAAAVVAGLGAGALAVPPGEVLRALTGTGAEPVASAVVVDIRLPRVLTGALVGAALAVAGAAMQGLFRNPLADPGLVGVSSGAALGAVVVIVAVGEAIGPARAWLLPLAAFAGALLATWVVSRLARFEGRTTTALLLLAGIAINAIAGAGLGLAAFVSTDEQLRDLTFWTLGSLAGVDPRAFWPAALLMAAVVVALPLLARLLDACLLGEREAVHLGFDVERGKLAIVVMVALGTGAAVAVAGIIGFVGLVVPHLARLCVGTDHRWLMPASAMLGAALLLTADIGARLVVLPAELPIGILTSALGGPFFLALLLANRRRFSL